MTERALLDTGPLVALLDADEEHHAWATGAIRRFRAPLLTCEPVLAESMHVLRRLPDAQDRILEWLGRGALVPAIDVAGESAALRRLMRKYRDRPMSLADACLVRLAETYPDHAVFTLDSDFRVYRKDGGAEIPVVMPDAR